MLAAVLDHDGQQLSATQTRQQALADADHLAVLHAIWTAETAPAREQRYRDLLLAALLPAGLWSAQVPAIADPERHAAAIGAWRELSGYDHPTEAIGPEPPTGTPDVRSVWFEALAALGPADGPDVRGLPDGRLLHLRDTYPIETAWAPRYVGDELRQVRAAAWNAHLAGLRASAEAKAASGRGQLHQALSSSAGHLAAQAPACIVWREQANMLL